MPVSAGVMSHEVSRLRTFEVPAGALVTSVTTQYYGSEETEVKAAADRVRHTALAKHTRYLRSKGVEFDWNNTCENYIHEVNEKNISTCTVELISYEVA